jgi:hypothetical protein
MMKCVCVCTLTEALYGKKKGFFMKLARIASAIGVLLLSAGVALAAPNKSASTSAGSHHRHHTSTTARSKHHRHHASLAKGKGHRSHHAHVSHS